MNYKSSNYGRLEDTLQVAIEQSNEILLKTQGDWRAGYTLGVTITRLEKSIQLLRKTAWTDPSIEPSTIPSFDRRRQAEHPWD